MNLAKNGLFVLSSLMRFHYLLGESPRRALTTLLYHRFLAPGESRQEARDRLQYQLEWLKSRYSVMSLSDALQHLREGDIPEFALTVTVDDAFVDILDVCDIFEDHGVPVQLFVCTGWIDNNEPPDAPATLSRVVDFIRWYKGECLKLDFGSLGSVHLNTESSAEITDRIILAAKDLGQDFVERTWAAVLGHRRERNDRNTCTWDEIQDLRQRGIGIGSHSVTHCRMAECSDVRLEFELEESKQTLEKHVGKTDFFAYPFGHFDVADARTSSAVASAGYKGALLTHAGFAAKGADCFTLPRLTIPDGIIAPVMYRALVKGGKVPFDRLRQAVIHRKTGHG